MKPGALWPMRAPNVHHLVLGLTPHQKTTLSFKRTSMIRLPVQMMRVIPMGVLL